MQNQYDWYYERDGQSRYDWVSPHGSRTPEEYPYSHDEYYLWRDFEPGDRTVESAYTDRMRQWNADKYVRATEGRMRNYHSVPVSRTEAQKVVTDYFGEGFVCVGVAQSMNVSNGYPLGILFFRRPSEQSS